MENGDCFSHLDNQGPIDARFCHDDMTTLLADNRKTGLSKNFDESLVMLGG